MRAETGIEESNLLGLTKHNLQLPHYVWYVIGYKMFLLTTI